TYVLFSASGTEQPRLFLRPQYSGLLDPDFVLYPYWYASLYLQCHSVVDADRGDCGQCRDGDSRCCRQRELYDDDTRLLAPPETQLCASVLCGFDHLLFYRFHAGNRGGLPKYKPAVAFYRFHSGPLAPYDVRHHHVHAVFFYL